MWVSGGGGRGWTVRKPGRCRPPPRILVASSMRSWWGSTSGRFMVISSVRSCQARVQYRFLGGRPPCGCRLVDGGRHPNPVHGRWGRRVLAPDPVTAPWARWMFAERARCRTVASLARELNERGVECPSGADPARNAHRSGERWIVRTVAMILGNPRYTNRSSTIDHGAGGRTGGRGSGALRYNPVSEWEVSERIAHEPLVDDETFVAVQGLRVAKPAKDGEVRRYLLAGLVVCGLRGRRMDGRWVHPWASGLSMPARLHQCQKSPCERPTQYLRLRRSSS
jgi:hypothetical protein